MELMVHAQGEVAGMINSGIPFNVIEDQIQQIPDLLDDQRSALWLYAWSRQGANWQRHASTQLLQWVTGRSG
jgi:rhamnogalacturonyl hydrolase YesR